MSDMNETEIFFSPFRCLKNDWCALHLQERQIGLPTEERLSRSCKKIADINTYIHIYIYIYLHVCTYTYTCTYVYRYIHIRSQDFRNYTNNIHICYATCRFCIIFIKWTCDRNELCHTYAWVSSSIPMSHVTQINEPRLTDSRGMSHMRTTMSSHTFKEQSKHNGVPLCTDS